MMNNCTIVLIAFKMRRNGVGLALVFHSARDTPIQAAACRLCDGLGMQALIL